MNSRLHNDNNYLATLTVTDLNEAHNIAENGMDFFIQSIVNQNNIL